MSPLYVALAIAIALITVVNPAFAAISSCPSGLVQDTRPSRVLLGWPRVSLDRKILIAGSAESAAVMRISASVSGVPSQEAHEAVAYVQVMEVSTRRLVATLSSAPFELRSGDSQWRTIVTIDADDLAGAPLSPGAYTAQPILVVGPGKTARNGIEKIGRILARSKGRPPFAARIGRENGLLVFGEEPDKVRRYEAEIATGKPELVYRGLSHLVMHYRARNRHDLAEKRIRAVLADPALQASPGLASIHPMFRYWIADDRLQKGDTAGAVAMLEKAMATTPEDAIFLGEPFAARALLHLARIKRLSGDVTGALAAYSHLVEEHADSALVLEALRERGETRLEAGDFAAARRDLAAIAALGDQCASNPPDIEQDAPRAQGSLGGEKFVPRCPDRATAAGARRLVRLIDSDRSWFRRRPEEVVTAVRAAFARRDLAVLSAIASREDMKFGAPGAEWTPIAWKDVAPHFAKLFREAVKLDVVEPSLASSPLRRYLLVRGIGDAPGLPSDLVLLVDNTPFGWQFSGMGGLFVRSCEGPTGSGDPACPGVPVAPQWRQKVYLKAPWAPGEYLRAGGLNFDIDWASFDSAGAAFDFLSDAILTFDHCGPGVPGYYYNTGPTHQGADRYAIDFMDGYGPLGCFDTYVFGEVCLPDPLGPAAALADLLNALLDLALSDVTAGPAYLDLLLAGHAGVVVNSEFMHPDGSTGDPNRIDIAIWPGVYPVSAAAYLAGTTSPFALHASNGLGSALATTGAPYWLKYLHLAQLRAGPSLGMWVQTGEVVGLIDDTGNSFISHLHFALHERPPIDTNVSNIDLWLSKPLTIEGDFLDSDDNGTCIRSKNKLVLADRDRDGVLDADDNCLVVANPEQTDSNGDNIGDACASDFDNDGVPNDQDSCPLDHSSFADCGAAGCVYREFDFDRDGIGDVCDMDRDGDGVPNLSDPCPQGDDSLDLDGDGAPDGCDADRDEDGWDDVCQQHRGCGCVPDMFRCDATRAGDYDGDGLDSLEDPCPCSPRREDCLPKQDPFLGPDDYQDVFGIGTPPGPGPI